MIKERICKVHCTVLQCDAEVLALEQDWRGAFAEQFLCQDSKTTSVETAWLRIGLFFSQRNLLVQGLGSLEGTITRSLHTRWKTPEYSCDSEASNIFIK